VTQLLAAESDVEILKAINSFSSDKSPGIDGIPTEMYLIFFTEFDFLLYIVF